MLKGERWDCAGEKYSRFLVALQTEYAGGVRARKGIQRILFNSGSYESNLLSDHSRQPVVGAQDGTTRLVVAPLLFVLPNREMSFFTLNEPHLGHSISCVEWKETSFSNFSPHAEHLYS